MRAALIPVASLDAPKENDVGLSAALQVRAQAEGTRIPLSPCREAPVDAGTAPVALGAGLNRTQLAQWRRKMPPLTRVRGFEDPTFGGST